jgi:hypothetical protein
VAKPTPGEIGEGGMTLWQVVEGCIRCISRMAIGFRPSVAGAILRGDVFGGVRDVRDQFRGRAPRSSSR